MMPSLQEYMMKSERFSKEVDRQINNLLQKGYAQAANLSPEAFLVHLEPLKKCIDPVALPEVDLEKGQLPFVVVVKSDLVVVEKAMTLVMRKGKEGVTKLYPRESKDFQPIDSVHLPSGMAYLLVDIDRGKETINMAPSEAMKLISSKNRSPLTIEEGIAIMTHYPEFLQKNNCFSLLASRHSKDKRVPAIWINGDKQPNLGWCWDGNPHTWLGSSSCGYRV